MGVTLDELEALAESKEEEDTTFATDEIDESEWDEAVELLVECCNLLGTYSDENSRPRALNSLDYKTFKKLGSTIFDFLDEMGELEPHCG